MVVVVVVGRVCVCVGGGAESCGGLVADVRDNTNADVWAALALVCLRASPPREREAACALDEAVRLGVRDGAALRTLAKEFSAVGMVRGARGGGGRGCEHRLRAGCECGDGRTARGGAGVGARAWVGVRAGGCVVRVFARDCLFCIPRAASRACGARSSLARAGAFFTSACGRVLHKRSPRK